MQAYEHVKMLSTKRKSTDIDLQRRVRARTDAEDEETSFSSSNEDSATEEELLEDDEGSETRNVRTSFLHSVKHKCLFDMQEASDSEEEEEVSAPASSISFGALAKAQSSLSNSSSNSRKKSKSSTTHDDGWSNGESLERKAGKKDTRDFSRTSKHAPQELSSKKAVSRRREVVPITKRQVRDPRFESASGMVNEQKIAKNYEFLEGYRDDEIKELKQAIKTTKDETAKERLKRELLSMESRKKTKERKDREMEVLQKHRREEKELVRQGKQPFYLKKSEQKERLLREQFDGLKGKGLDRVIERRRKKIEGKEKKKLPWQRREV